MIAFFILFSIIGISGILCLINGSGLYRVFKGCISNSDFRSLTNQIFKSELKICSYRVETKNHSIWIANSYYGFEINKVTEFSLYQKYYFFKKLREYRINKAGLTKASALLYRKE